MRAATIIKSFPFLLSLARNTQHTKRTTHNTHRAQAALADKDAALTKLSSEKRAVCGRWHADAAQLGTDAAAWRRRALELQQEVRVWVLVWVPHAARSPAVVAGRDSLQTFCPLALGTPFPSSRTGTRTRARTTTRWRRRRRATRCGEELAHTTFFWGERDDNHLPLDDGRHARVAHAASSKHTHVYTRRRRRPPQQARLNKQAATIGELQASLASAEQAQQSAERLAGQLLHELEGLASGAQEQEARLRLVVVV